jgi:hypothetical protein
LKPTKKKDMKYEFILSDQFRQFHFLVGVLLSQLCVSFNENKEQRKLAICIMRNLLCKHSYDNRYNDDKNKQARIASLYLPLIDVLIENLDRISTNQINNQTASIKSTQLNHLHNGNSQTSSEVSTSNSRACSSNASQTAITHHINSNGASSTTSLLNDNLSTEGGSGKPSNEASSVFGAIAGIGGTKLNPLEAIICPISDSDSLSSADDAQFKHLNKRSSSLITGSTNNSDQLTINHSNSINASNLLAVNNSNGSNGYDQTKSYCVIRKDKLETNEVKDLLVCIVYVLKNISHGETFYSFYYIF